MKEILCNYVEFSKYYKTVHLTYIDINNIFTSIERKSMLIQNINMNFSLHFCELEVCFHLFETDVRLNIFIRSNIFIHKKIYIQKIFEFLVSHHIFDVQTVSKKSLHMNFHNDIKITYKHINQ